MLDLEGAYLLIAANGTSVNFTAPLHPCSPLCRGPAVVRVSKSKRSNSALEAVHLPLVDVENCGAILTCAWSAGGCQLYMRIAVPSEYHGKRK